MQEERRRINIPRTDLISRGSLHFETRSRLLGGESLFARRFHREESRKVVEWRGCCLNHSDTWIIFVPRLVDYGCSSIKLREATLFYRRVKYWAAKYPLFGDNTAARQGVCHLWAVVPKVMRGASVECSNFSLGIHRVEAVLYRTSWER